MVADRPPLSEQTATGPTRVLFAMSVPERRGGAEKMLWLLLREHDPSRIAPRIVFLEPGPFAHETRSAGIPTAVIAAGRLRQIGRGARAVGSLARVIHRERPDVVLAWTGNAHLYAGTAAALVGRSATSAWWIHDIPSFSWFDRVTQVIPAAAIGSSSAIGADTLSGLRPRRKTFVVRPGVEDFMKPGWMEQRATARARLGVGEQDIVVALIARFHPQKGQGRFVAALKLLHDAGVPVRGLLVGGTAHGQNAGYEPLVMRQIADSGLADCVMHIDHVSEPWGYLLAADIYVNARERENLSLGILEAACAGRAIIAPATGGTPEILEDETSGLLIATPDPHSLAAAIRRLVEDRQLRGRLGSGARSLYERRFTVARMVRELEDAIVGLADGGAGSPL